jgi:hypothetical protein
MALSAPFCPLANLLNPDQSGRWLVGAVGIEPSSPLATRKLLIPRFDKSDKNDKSAQARYATSTREEIIPFPDTELLPDASFFLTDLPLGHMIRSIQGCNSSARLQRAPFLFPAFEKKSIFSKKFGHHSEVSF